MAHGKGNNQTATEDPPVDAIREAALIHPKCIVYLKRRLPQGTWNNIPGKTEQETISLLHPEEWILPLVGGGRIRVEAMVPDNPSEWVVPPFMVNIEAPPKPMGQIRAENRAMQAGGAFAGGGGFMQPPYPPYPPYPYPYPMGDAGDPPDPRQYWAQPPDAVAQENTRAMRRELDKANDEHKKEREELLKRIDRLTERLADNEKRHAEAIAKEQIARLEAKFEAMNKNGNKDSTTAELVKAVASFVPVVTALITTSKDTKALDISQQQKMQELQLQTIQTFMKSNAGAFTDLLKVALPALAPMMIKMFEERSPSKMAELIGTMGESNLTMFSMLGDIMSRVLPSDPENPWMNVIQQGLDSLKTMAQQMANVSKPGPARLPGSQQQPPANQNGAVQQDQAKAIADAICNEPALDARLRTKEWHFIYLAIHSMAPPKEVANMIGTRMSDMQDRGELPNIFKPIFEDESQPPSAFLKPLLEQLPIAQYPDYIKALLQAFDATFVAEDAVESAGSQ